ncbi:hypothetical protein [Hyphomonas sp. CACIAM 19H1]|uniref:hypothetical protein n=1 Tax=Hyphomonas sp. CACIAM 19H1 TaxID=1873716 RepID=UPI0013B06257|nr:hypothetical protein [Hyphomonas sp. CACIAM 19H1]
MSRNSGHGLTCCARTEAEISQEADTFKPLIAEAVIQFYGPSCGRAGLLPLEEAARFSEEEEAVWSGQIADLNGDQIARLAIKCAEEHSATEEGYNRNLLYLLVKSADKGSALGLNELGAAQMYCYQGVKRDIPSAAKWLEAAVAKHDTQAMQSLGFLHVNGLLGGESSFEYGKSLLLRCSIVGNQDCKTQYEFLGNSP